MKSLLNSFIVIAVLLIFVPSCKKNATNTPESIIGKWNIQKDSTSTGVGSGNHLVIYNGKSGDYFNFSTDGHLYTSENSILDTLNYTISSDSIMIPDFGYVGGVGKGLIPFLSTHSLIITSGYFLTPGGAFGRTVYLYR
ncbi:MAG TPA: hypothetical protein VMU83_07490 [Hanamia sp.]|nr:hypothetical protein [Hanamia sp.]